MKETERMEEKIFAIYDMHPRWRMMPNRCNLAIG